MAIPTSGPVSFNTLKTEYNDTDPVQLTDFYRGGLVPDSAINNGNVPTSGEISIADLRGSSNEFIVSVSSPTTVLNVQSLFPTPVWSSSTPKTVNIDSGVVIGATLTTEYALTVPSGAGGVVTINNAGNIRAAGGAGGVSGAGGNGGNAVRVQSPTTITNTGTIYAGGGGGGRGSTGSTGCCPNPPSCRDIDGGGGCCSGFCDQGSKIGDNCFVAGACPGCNVFCVARCRICNNVPCSPRTGGAGGNGGRGRGYLQSSQPGQSGGDPRGCGSGGGFTGGEGGTWGTSGERGLGGGAFGGLSGSYIVGDSLVTWNGGRGDVAGNVA